MNPLLNKSSHNIDHSHKVSCQRVLLTNLIFTQTHTHTHTHKHKHTHSQDPVTPAKVKTILTPLNNFDR